MDFVFPLIVILFIAFVMSMMISGKGKNLLFGGKIVKTMEGGSKSKKRLISTGVKVHVIEVAPNVRNIGIEIKQSSGLGFQMMPVSLPVSEAKALADTTYEAIDSK